ncbi:MAG: DNA polymerase/3'-5' exonuclease PolX [Syntrophobacterales bacterium]|nr:MAG: DNA polymerase/3'-5' exonuclease PolX [Syntrophobacterales bacterium]
MKNKEISGLFEKMADLLEFKGENPFKVSAYRKAARIIGDLTRDIEEISRRGQLLAIPGVGEGIAKKISEYLETGTVAAYEELHEGITDELMALMDIPGMGPKTLSLIHKEVGIKDMADLSGALEDGRLIELPGMGEKKVESIKRGIELLAQSRGRMNLGLAFPLANRIVESMKRVTGLTKIEVSGSLRRMRENIGDIDILATGSEGKKIIAAFTGLPEVREVLASGDTKGSVVVEGGIQIDLRAVEEESYGAALQYFTGSKPHNIHLRTIARARDIKINEYGVFRNDKRIAGREENGVYSALGMIWMPPELREDRGEIEAAQRGELPNLLELSDIQGDLHVHSNWSDGSSDIDEIARWGESMGHQYVAICDHSKSLKIAGGLAEDRLLQQMDEIDRINEQLNGFRLLKGTEVDILPDGTLDLSDEVLSHLDIVIAAIHTGFKQPRERITERIVLAMENPHVDIIAHPTGRLLGSREPYDLDLDHVMEMAIQTHTSLEINAYHERLDLNDIHCMRAKEKGVMISIGTDAHHPEQMWMMSLGAAVARRGWLEKGDVLNCLPAHRLIQWCRKG